MQSGAKHRVVICDRRLSSSTEGAASGRAPFHWSSSKKHPADVEPLGVLHPHHAAVEARKAEAERAAAILGCELRLLTDNAIRIDDMKNYQLVGMLDALVREFRPAAVLTHSANEFHRDHVVVHQACISTQRLKSFDFFQFSPTMTRAVPVSFHPRAYIDISTTIDLKMQSIEAHTSQFGGRGLEAEMYRDLARLNGRMVGVQYAEGLDVGRMLLA